jgi:FkbM family methyltransferase
MIDGSIKKFILTYIPRSFFNKTPIINIINAIRKIIFIFNIYKSLYVLKKNLLTFKTNNLHHHNYLRFYNAFFCREALLFKNFSKKLTSQLGQDLFIMSELNFKKNGYFVEFGATNGIDLSNTYFLEKYLNWQGIVAEPVHSYHHKLKANRNCNIDTKCVWSKTWQILDFAETEYTELSTLTSCIGRDFHKDTRKKHVSYKVETISLLDLLKAHNAPKYIDYLSVDTEGSEFEILEAFDFTAYDIKVITVEHNYNAYREKIYNLLIAQGYQQVYKEHSQFDDWYVKL